MIIFMWKGRVETGDPVIIFFCFLLFQSKRVKSPWNGFLSSSFKISGRFLIFLNDRKVRKLKAWSEADSHLPKIICLICFIETPLKMMKNAFYFILKALFVLKILKLLSWVFGHVEKRAWVERWGEFQNSWRDNLVNKQLQYTFCPIPNLVN